eukprot:jgi/Psemu1/50217/gm1.50217_g
MARFCLAVAIAAMGGYNDDYGDYADYQDYNNNDYGQEDSLYYDYAEHDERKK